MADKVTTMVLKVDLECSCCVKKIKKVLCKFPQIRDRVYDEKQNTVTITVVCCNPEKLRDKLCCKGGKTIKSIEIKEPPKPKAPEKPKEPEKPKAVEKPKEPEKPKAAEKPKEPEKPKTPEKPKDPVKQPKAPEPAPVPIYVPVPCYPYPSYPFGTCCGTCSEGQPGGPCYHGHGRPVPPPQDPAPAYIPVSGYPYPSYPVGDCCGSCSEGQPGGPCYQGYGRPVPSYDNYGAYGYGYGGSRPCEYYRDDNSSGCTIM